MSYFYGSDDRIR